MKSDPTPLSRLAYWFYAMVIEGFAIVVAIALHPLRYFKRYRRPCGASSGRPILLVHGYLHDCSIWIYLRHYLKKAGFGPIYVLNLGAPFRSIQSHAQKIEEIAEEIEKKTHRKDLILIGHSMGGLVSCWYATQIAPIGKVTDVITIGSPLAGTVMAQIAIGQNGREMKRNSPFIQKLQEAIRSAKRTKFYQIASSSDQLVIPYISALIETHPKERQYLVHDIGHMGLLFSRRVARQIQKWLMQTSSQSIDA